MRDPRAPNLVLGGQTRDVRAGAADPAALDNGCPPSRLRHVPSQQLAALSAAEDQDLESFLLRHRRVSLGQIVRFRFEKRAQSHRKLVGPGDKGSVPPRTKV